MSISLLVISLSMLMAVLCGVGAAAWRFDRENSIFADFLEKDNDENGNKTGSYLLGDADSRWIGCGAIRYDLCAYKIW